MNSLGKSIALITVLVLSWALVAHGLCIPRKPAPSSVAPASGSTPPGSAPSGPASPAPAPPGSPPSGPASSGSAPAGAAPSGSSAPPAAPGSPPSPSAPAAAAPSSTPSSSATPSGGASLGSGAKQGTASFYTEWSSNPGSCGAIPNTEDIAAINPSYMPAKCNQCIMVNYNGKSLKVKVTDTCPSCGPTKIDLSDRAFAKLEDKGKGIINITWDFVPC